MFKHRLAATGAALFAASIATVPLSATAAEFAEYHVLGYSADGQHFAFEQFGISDGVGLPYADVFILHLEEDSWVSGTPVRVRLEEGDLAEPIDFVGALADVRDTARDLAEPLLDLYEISGAHRVLAATTPMEAGGQEHAMGFYPRPIVPAIDPLHTLTIENYPLASPNECFGMVDTQGFRLTLDVDGGASDVIYEDTRLPRSRPCPEGYGLAAIVAPFDGAPGRAVALVSIYQLGFEGSDRRFLAVPFDLP
ncbi:MAG: DUF2259 domain-containing protein [Devosiaceae bacterium]|nr:DUF2259 domain-containing protein [Devosiaceae bacterium MH13]